ncbi:protein GRIM REAPER [Coffea eugenioides]|uniref:protein GRIM REAPER n=1 Tax=Coffea eugenioides TaxID=49369 RepID=UPI000F6101FC|nr:protein GRIM REAPER [Coffea eugenioides]
MATKLLKLLTVLSLSLALLHSQTSVSSSSATILEDDDDQEEYILDAPFAHSHLRSRFLASVKKGSSCNSQKKNKCNGVWANGGTSLLYCCKNHCRNVLGDANNCGRCGSKCKLNEKCCGGRCINVMYDRYNCGKCGGRCKKGLKCGHGYCGYA